MKGCAQVPNEAKALLATTIPFAFITIIQFFVR